MKIKYNNHLIYKEKYKDNKKERGIYFYLACPLTEKFSNIIDHHIANICRSKYSYYLEINISNDIREYLKIFNYLEKIVIINGKKKISLEKSIYDYPGLYSLFKQYLKYYLNILIK